MRAWLPLTIGALIAACGRPGPAASPVEPRAPAGDSSARQPETVSPPSLKLAKIPGARPRNVIFILSDDHRFDFMGFTGRVPHWESFQGQGDYFAPTLNSNGQRVSYPRDIHVTDLLTEHEQHNLIDAPEHQTLIRELAGELYDWLERTGGMQIPLTRTVKHRFGDYQNRGTY